MEKKVKKFQKKATKFAKKNKKTLLIAGIGASIVTLATGLGKAISNKKKRVKVQ